MSGFEFTIACSTCGLRAHDYPWYRRLFSGEVELPAVDADGLGRVCFVPTGPLTPEALLREAASHLRDGQRALVPTFADGEIHLVPTVPCPRDGGELVARFGR